MSKGLNPDQNHRFVGPDLGQTRLQRLLEDDKLSLATMLLAFVMMMMIMTSKLDRF